MSKFLRISCLAAVTVASCASVGSDFNEAGVTRLKPGATTLEEATQVLGGRPSQTVWHDNKSVTHIWQFIRASAAGVSQNKMITLIFDANGKLLRVGHVVNISLSDDERKRLGVMSASTMQ